MLLIIDDEKFLLESQHILLEEVGFEVLCAEDGASGIALFEAHRADIAAVLVDLSMPGMDGGQVFGALHAMEPEVPIIIMSGYDADSCVEDLLARGACGFLRKPYLCCQLETMLQLMGIMPRRVVQ